MDALIWVNDCEGNFGPSFESALTKRLGFFYPFDYEGDGDIDFINARGMIIESSGNSDCRPGEGGGGDYIDFSVLLNVRPEAIRHPKVFKDGFEPQD